MTQAATYRQRFQDPAAAERYATRFQRGSRKRIDQREQRAVRKIFAGLDGCATVADVPAGAGRFLPVLRRDRRVIEIDASHEMLTLGRQRAGNAGSICHFVQGDASRLPLASGAVDCVFCNRLLHHILSSSERAVFLREMHRVSRRYLVISFFDYQAFGSVRRALKVLKGRKPQYDQQPTLEQFREEAAQTGFRLRAVIPTGPAWVAEKYLVLEKA
jgi:SAM-dependent methyltransferase